MGANFMVNTLAGMQSVSFSESQNRRLTHCGQTHSRPTLAFLLCLSCLSIASLCISSTASGEPKRHAFFGDLHIHTQNSIDAYLFNARVTPDDAYRYARGGEINHPSGFPMHLQSGPLDFAAVTDHGQFMGVLPMLSDPKSSLGHLPLGKLLSSSDRSEVGKAIQTIVKMIQSPSEYPQLSNPNLTRNAWQETIDAAERYNQPGKFTTFIGYEYSSAPKNQNLHRNVIFNSTKVPEVPFSTLSSANPEMLWSWMDALREKGIDSLAIPHNPNVSNGLMFQDTNWAGEPLDEQYALQRMRNEPVVEVSQVKGTSETHPTLSPDDEWAGFELYDYLIASTTISKKSGGFVREAYRLGLNFQDKSGFNPYKFGLIGSTDTHSAGGSNEESNYSGKVGTRDGTPQRRGGIPATPPSNDRPGFSAATFSQWSAAGLAGVWAEENTRDSLFNSIRRKEVFATSGPRIRVRFFASYNFPDDILQQKKMIEIAYQQGVPMGGTLSPAEPGQNISPDFLVMASKDPDSAKLQRAQIIKGWSEKGETYEQVFDVACSGGRTPNPKNHRCPDNNATVSLTDCSYTSDTHEEKGANELLASWKDPAFNDQQQAFYYARIIENPSCRWTTWDALRAGVAPNPDLDTTIQERAWSSPIWFSPE
jgi:hypothetical protein